jgi:hypothetical protein
MKTNRTRFAIIVMFCVLIGTVAVPTTNAVSKYVTQTQRVKDLQDIAEQIVKLQNRVRYLEKCISNLTVNQYNSGTIKTVNC